MAGFGLVVRHPPLPILQLTLPGRLETIPNQKCLRLSSSRLAAKGSGDGSVIDQSSLFPRGHEERSLPYPSTGGCRAGKPTLAKT
jgi:hypothetical protein